MSIPLIYLGKLTWFCWNRGLKWKAIFVSSEHLPVCKLIENLEFKKFILTVITVSIDDKRSYVFHVLLLFYPKRTYPSAFSSILAVTKRALPGPKLFSRGWIKGVDFALPQSLLMTGISCLNSFCCKSPVFVAVLRSGDSVIE